jgi:transcriptional regulator with XRE-family HTH domain
MNAKLLKQRSLQVGQQIREARERADLSQRALGLRCGLTHADISRLENGKQNPRLQSLLKVLFALGIDRFSI